MKLNNFLMRSGGFVAVGFSITFVLFFLSCDDDPTSSNLYSVSEDFSYRIAIGNNTSLRLEAINGTVEVNGISNIDSVWVWGEREVEAESVEEAEAHLSELAVRIDEHDGQVIVWTDQPEQSNGRDYEVEYNIQVPKDWHLDIKQVNGDLNISAMEQSLSAGLTNGNMRLWDIAGSVEGNLVNGDIESKVYLPAGGICDLSTVNGSVDLMIPHYTSAKFYARVVNGSIDISNLTFQNQSVTSTSISGTLGSGDGRINLITVNGNIHAIGF